jgi:hypothetical protein
MFNLGQIKKIEGAIKKWEEQTSLPIETHPE